MRRRDKRCGTCVHRDTKAGTCPKTTPPHGPVKVWYGQRCTEWRPPWAAEPASVPKVEGGDDGTS